ncbi:HNH endonuclease family protein [Oryzobacter telluris]|uniref:HNH endonuclease family protein n=1 Tax=Oryzobacter telluris TaxID=3149179 RepID=UPI00370D7D99
MASAHPHRVVRPSRPRRASRTGRTGGVLRRFVAAAALAVLALPVGAAVAAAAPPPPPDESDSRAQLATLHVGYEDNVGYDRSLFTHWITISGTCDTRETVLKRDGTGVTTDSSCRATGGTWKSVYDDRTFTVSSDLDIDHVVPLAEAWGSGANLWDAARRKAFANDLNIPQLIAVSASSNRSKSDQDPAEWQPPSTGWHCQYARSWIQVKYVYDLEVNSAEKTALTGMLDASC